MKNILSILSFMLIGSGPILAQGYNPMLADSNKWTIVTWFEGCYTVTIKMAGDTLVNNILYKKVYHSDSLNNIYDLRSLYREDTLSRRIYSLKVTQGTVVNFPEHVHYDFSLQVGDSIQLWNDHLVQNIHPLGDSLGWYTVDSISSFTTYSGPRKLLHLTKNYFVNDKRLDNVVWLESIGEVDLVWRGETSSLYYWMSHPSTIQCFFRNEDKIIFNPVWGSAFIDPCYCFHSFDIGVHEVTEQMNASVAVPNPFKGSIQMIFNDVETSSSIVTIYNDEGKKVFVKEVRNKEKIDLSFLPSGIYFLTFPIDGRMRSQKIVKD